MKKFLIRLIFVCSVIIGLGAYYKNIYLGKSADVIKNDTKQIVTTSLDSIFYSDINTLEEATDEIIRCKIIDTNVEMINLNSSEDENAFNVLCTVYTVNVNEVYKGNYNSGDVIKIKQLGGENDQIIHNVDGFIDLDKTNEYIFFLQSYDKPDMPASLINATQAAYVYNNRSTRSLSAGLVSVNKENNINITFNDILNIKNKY